MTTEQRLERLENGLRVLLAEKFKPKIDPFYRYAYDGVPIEEKQKLWEEDRKRGRARTREIIDHVLNTGEYP